MGSPKFTGATILELVKKVIKVDKKLGIYTNGADNLYPERIERIINSSPTAKPATKLFRKYVGGRGINEINDTVVNVLGQTFREFHRDVCESYAYQNGAFISISYNLKYEISGFKVIPFKWCRLGKPDDQKYSGKVIVYDAWDEGSPKKDEIKAVNVFNPDPEVVKYQISKCDGKDEADKLKNYPGQVLFWNPENTIYPLAHIDCAYEDADSEKRASTFRNKSLRKGFFGKTVAITPPMMGEFVDIAKESIEKEDTAQLDRYNRAESERENFRETIQEFIGAENVDGVMHIEIDPGDKEGLDDVVKFETIKSDINDKMFEYTDKASANNVRKAINCIPAILIEKNDSALFGNSGEMLKEARLSFQEQCEEDRELIEGLYKKLLPHYKPTASAEVEIEKLIPS